MNGLIKMMEELNFCELLKGHEGETFWVTGGLDEEVTLISISKDYFTFRAKDNEEYSLLWHGGLWRNKKHDCMFFPSENQRDWEKWVEEQKSKTPKTWSEYCKIVPPPTKDDCKDYPHAVNSSVFIRKDATPIEKSALALMKIHTLIEQGYGGNPLYQEKWDNQTNEFAEIYYNPGDNEFYICWDINSTGFIIFRTTEQAQEFLSHEENRQLLRDYYMI